MRARRYGLPQGQAEQLGGADKEKVDDSAVTQVKKFIQDAGSTVVIYKVFDGMDNDGDGCIDEELLDGIDNDGDGRADEDSRGAPDPGNAKFRVGPDGADNNLDGSAGRGRRKGVPRPLPGLHRPWRPAHRARSARARSSGDGAADTRSKGPGDAGFHRHAPGWWTRYRPSTCATGPRSRDSGRRNEHAEARCPAAPLPAALLLAAAAAGRPGPCAGPQYLSGRALGMGDAFVALSDDYNAIYYNPAGLARLNTPLDAGMSLKFDMGDFFGVAGDAVNIAGEHADSFSSMDGMAEDATLVDDMMVFDRKPLGFGTLPEMHFAARSTDPDFPLGIGAAWFLGSQGRFMLDKGDLHALRRGPGAHRFRRQGRRRHRRPARPQHRPLPHRGHLQHLRAVASACRSTQTAGDTLTAQIDEEKERIYEPGFGLGYTAGVLYDIVPTELRVGVVMYNLFLSMDGDKVPATYSVGLAYLPAVLRKQGMLRYVNFAVDIQDVFADKPFLGKVNMGAEMNLSLAQVRGGFKGGYPTYGLLLNLLFLQMEFTTWAEEAGLYVGQLEDRHYLFGVRMGI